MGRVPSVPLFSRRAEPGPPLQHGLDLAAVPEGWEAEFVADGRDLKEACLWSPAWATARGGRRATVLPAGAVGCCVTAPASGLWLPTVSVVSECTGLFTPSLTVTVALTVASSLQLSVSVALCVLPVPKGVSLIDAAALPEVHFTVWTNLMDAARLKKGESVLIHGGSSGIGTAAIQMLHARGHKVFTTAGSVARPA